jgi:hypothetical protein
MKAQVVSGMFLADQRENKLKTTQKTTLKT